MSEIWHEPEIYLLARPAMNLEGLTGFLESRGMSWVETSDASDAETVAEVAGRICYMSFSKDIASIRYPNSKYLANIIDSGHESVIEHATWTFIIDRVSRAFSHQLVRHRVGTAFSQLSQQYHDETDADFVYPQGLPVDGRDEWISSVKCTLGSYKKLISKMDEGKLSKEQKRNARSSARSILPSATATCVALTINARALRHFISIRGVIIGDIEMRMVCTKLLLLMKQEAPSMFSDFSITEHTDGYPIIQRG